MAKYILLANWTDHGITQLQDSAKRQTSSEDVCAPLDVRGIAPDLYP